MGSLRNDFMLYCIRRRLVLISGEGKLEISIIGWHQAFYFVHMTFAGRAYRRLISVMYSLFLASVIMFFQPITNLFLLKSYKFHLFRVRNVLVSFLYLIIWFDFAAWSMPFLILLSGDTETKPSPNLWTKFFNFPREFKQYLILPKFLFGLLTS